MSTLESILSGERESAPVETNSTAVTPETTQEQPQGQPDLSPTDDSQTDDKGMVPVAALQAERQKAKRYTEQVAEFQAQLERQNAQIAQMMSAIAPRQAAPEPVQAPEIWDDPNAFVRAQASELISPMQQQMRAMAREVAEVRFQPETVAKAVDAFDSAVKTGRIDPVIHQRIMASPNPYAAAVQWHQQTTVMSEIGNDPAAYKARMAEEIRAQVMAELQQGNGTQGQQQRPAPVMPGNFATGRNVGARSGPAYSGPPSLEDILTRR